MRFVAAIFILAIGAAFSFAQDDPNTNAVILNGQIPPGLQFDILILDGTVIADGDSVPIVRDIGITGDRIELIGSDLSSATAPLIIDATGLLVVPGFIDVHSHADSGGNSNYVKQGVTTIVAGNCGGSRGQNDMEAHLASREGSIDANYVTLVGHNSLRSMVGLTGSTPTANQMEQMKMILRSALQEGAFGLSTGLIYATGYNSTTDELVELAQVVAEEGGIYTSHIRGEDGRVLTAVAEALEIGRRANVRVQISHIKCAGPLAWGKADDYLVLVDTALEEGVDVMLDQYPYTASQTTINVLFPAWAVDNWNDAVNNQRARLEEDIRLLLAGRGGAERVFFISGPFNRQYLSDAAASAGKDPEDLLIDDVGLSGANAVYHQMLEDEVQFLMQHPLTMIGSDGPTGGHPRGQGTFARVWGYYGREEGLFEWPELVAKTSTLASRRFRLDEQKRGAIKEGWFADIAVFDPERIIDRATFVSPGTSALGMKWVLVNGELGVQNGSTVSDDPGRALKLRDSLTPPEAK